MKQQKDPLFPNQDTSVKCGRHQEMTCTEAHDSHVQGLIDRDHRIEVLEDVIKEIGRRLKVSISAHNAEKKKYMNTTPEALAYHRGYRDCGKWILEVLRIKSPGEIYFENKQPYPDQP